LHYSDTVSYDYQLLSFVNNYSLLSLIDVRSKQGLTKVVYINGKREKENKNHRLALQQPSPTLKRAHEKKKKPEKQKRERERERRSGRFVDQQNARDIDNSGKKKKRRRECSQDKKKKDLKTKKKEMANKTQQKYHSLKKIPKHKRSFRPEERARSLTTGVAQSKQPKKKKRTGGDLSSPPSPSPLSHQDRNRRSR